MDGRDKRLADAFVALADSLVAEFDVIDLLDDLTRHCVELLDTAEAGLLLTDPQGNLKIAAASTEAARVLELFQLQNEEGPCADCLQSGSPVVVEDIRDTRDRWPRFAPLAEAGGFLSVHALPMRLRDEVIGTLNLFRRLPGVLSEADIAVGQALADVATISILQHRIIARGELLAEQLQNALTSRVVIEQAKGILAERAGVSVGVAFERLRAFARRNNLRLADVCRDVINGDVSPALLEHRASA